MGFKKFQNFVQNSMVLAFGFSVNASLWQKLTEALYFLSMTPYSISVIHNSPVYKFLWVLKKFKFLLKIQKC
jgi:hypothetical protein